MRLIKLEGNGQLRVFEAPDPHPGPHEVLVRTAVSALCGSELHGVHAPGGQPGNAGHEAAGVVIATGDEVASVSVGQRVGLTAVVGCGHCEACAAGRYTWCSQRRFIGNMHADRIVIPARGCHPLPDDVTWDAGVLLAGDGLGVPYHTSTKLTDPAIRTVAIFGAGPIGLGNLLMQRFLGREVIAIDLSRARLDLAVELGAAHVVDASTTDPVAAVIALTAGRGADVCLEAAGRPQTLRHCFAAVRTGGVVAMNGEQGALPLSPSEDFIRRDITAFGSWYVHFGEFPQILALYRRGLPVESLISHRFPLEEAGAAFEEFAAARTGKVLLIY